MTATQLRLLRVLGRQFISDAVQQLYIALMRVLLERRHKSPAHGARRLARNIGVLRRLLILGARPHNNIGRRSLGLLVPLVCRVASGCFLEETHSGRSHTAEIAAGIGRDDGEKALASFFGEVGFFENALCGVDVREIEGRARVAGVEDGGQAHTRLKALDHDSVHLIVDDVTDSSEVDRVDDFVIAVLFIAVQIGCLAAVAGVMEEEGVIGSGVFDEPVHGA